MRRLCSGFAKDSHDVVTIMELCSFPGVTSITSALAATRDITHPPQCRPRARPRPWPRRRSSTHLASADHRVWRCRHRRTCRDCPAYASPSRAPRRRRDTVLRTSQRGSTQRRNNRASSSLFSCSKNDPFANSAPSAKLRLTGISCRLPARRSSDLAPTVRFTIAGRPSLA